MGAMSVAAGGCAETAGQSRGQHYLGAAELLPAGFSVLAPAAIEVHPLWEAQQVCSMFL